MLNVDMPWNQWVQEWRHSLEKRYAFEMPGIYNRENQNSKAMNALQRLRNSRYLQFTYAPEFGCIIWFDDFRQVSLKIKKNIIMIFSAFKIMIILSFIFVYSMDGLTLSAEGSPRGPNDICLVLWDPIHHGSTEITLAAH